MRSRLSTLILLLVPAVQGLGRTAWASAPGSVAEQYLFAAANSERTQRGLQPLRWDDSLYRAAGAHAQEMAARASISHQYPGEPELSARGRQAGVRFSLIAENVAESPDAVTMHTAWMNSPGHRANLLDPQVDSVGIRVIRRGGELYAVEDFARTVTDLALPDQETAVEAQLQTVANVTILPPGEDSRRTCAMETGYAGSWRPTFVMRYTTTDLAKLPKELRAQLESGRYGSAAVGACAVTGTQDFSAYKVAVMLFP
jgi:hypothetical protein